MDSIGMKRKLGEQGPSCVLQVSVKPRWANPWNAEGDGGEEKAGQGACTSEWVLIHKWARGWGWRLMSRGLY